MQQNEERSETERHWDSIAGTSITVATAAAAAVFFIARNSGQRPGPTGDLELFNAVMAIFSIGMYLTTVALAGAGIFAGINLGSEERARWKRQRTHEAFGAFWTILVMTAITAFTTFTLPALQSWYQQQTETQNPAGKAMQWPGFEIQVTREDILDTSRNPLESATSRALQGTRFEGLQVNVWEERLTVQNYPEENETKETDPTNFLPHLNIHMSPLTRQWLEKYSTALELPDGKREEALGKLDLVTLILDNGSGTTSFPSEEWSN